MARRVTRRAPFGYRSGSTPLHRIPAGLKLLALLALSAAAFGSLPGLAVSALLVTVFAAIARVKPWELLRGSKPLALRIFVSFAAGSLLFAVTTMGSLRRSLGKAEQAARLLARRVLRANKTETRREASAPFRQGRASLGISLMLGFLPRFFELWEDANLACDARCCKRGPRRMKLLIPLVTERMMEAAADAADALESKQLTLLS
jgi:biotin transport system permease protein